MTAKYDFIAKECSKNGEAGFMVTQLRPDGSVASEDWHKDLDSLLNCTVEGHLPRIQIIRAENKG